MPERVEDESVEETTTGSGVVSDATAPEATEDVGGDAVAHAGDDRGAAVADEPAAPPVADAELLAAVDLARAALLEITPADTVGEPAGSTVEGDRVLSLLFANTMPGYPGWYWTVTLARVEDAAPTVLEAELMPGEGALLSPEWLPWSDRLAGIEADEEAERLAAESGSDEDDDDDDEDDDESDDSSDDDTEDADDVLDGVDFESPPAADDDDDDDDDDTSFDGADR
ncbi:DUF3027 domain-containing protein [Clavibacter sp. Sh2036]|uniref:DUF3027 domain-containing protein n=1 Tax=unclassified Clavibacter TaxID=2626594 RepID=UPI0022EB28DB|nr:DUF3027 domain-containing protein [Clavibacter sp. CT19]MDA3803893.1 DUF3027 domain-containing protein [Clavibacter sp. CT19]